uniref:Uncharacterized protein n=1 Tax=Anguilla anguilla TaxID=7936 RepID=A0A0E9Q534_ANGAN
MKIPISRSRDSQKMLSQHTKNKLKYTLLSCY